MKRGALVFAVLALLTLPTVSPVQTHADHGNQPKAEQQGGHGPMSMRNTKTIMLGEQTVEGVTAMAHLNDVGALTAKMGMKENYHLMLMFTDAATGKAVSEGAAAVKITDPETGKAGAPIPIMGMGDHFGADIALPVKGKYSFEIGTKLADNKTRQFTFQYTVQ